MQEALLAAICAAPDDDLPRLACADWLEEQGQSDRAEIIRVQIELARLPEGDRRAAKLQRREKALLKQHGSAWCDTHLGLVGQMRRGFIEHVECWPHNALETGATLVERFPVRSLCLRVDHLDWKKVRELGRQPWLARLRALRFLRNLQPAPSATPLAGLSDHGLEALLESSHLGNLQVLELPSAGITAAGARALAQARHLSGLRELDLTWCNIGAAGMEHLAGAAHLAGLTRLVLEATHLRAAGAAALASSPHLRSLRRLDLARSGILIGGVRALTDSPVLATVQSLRLGRLKLGVQAARCLARSPHLAELRELDLNSNKLGDDGAAALADGPALAGLQRLSLRKNRIAISGAAALASADHWGLQHLDLTGNDLSSADKAHVRRLFGKAGLRL